MLHRGTRIANFMRTPIGVVRLNAARTYLEDAFAKDIPTVKLAYELHNAPSSPKVEKSPIIFLHGLFGSKANTRTVAKDLAKSLSRQVYCLDLRNFGASPHIPRLDYPSLAADVEQFVKDNINPELKPILVGHSMGAKTVMAVALRNPDLPSLVVAVDNAPVDIGNIDSSFSKYINQLRVATEKYKYTDIADVEATLAKVEKSKIVRQFLLMNMNRGRKEDPVTSKIPLDVVGKAISSGTIMGWPYDLNLNRWNGPTLFIRGTESNYIPDDVIPDLGKYFPDFELRDIKSGHWVISQKPEEFKEILSEWIERKEDD